MNLYELAIKIHDAAVNKGFWNLEDPYTKHEAKMLSELGEVVQADRAGVMYEVEREGAKPEGVAAELADYVMMLLDYAMQLELPVEAFENAMADNAASFSDADDLPCAPLVMNLMIPLAMMVVSKLSPTRMIIGCTQSVESWLKKRGYDLWGIIEAKLAYNESRPALHGRLY